MKQIKVSRKKAIKIQTTKEGAHYYISNGVKYWKRKDLTRNTCSFQDLAYPPVVNVISRTDTKLFQQLDIQRWEGAVYLPEIAIKAYIFGRNKVRGRGWDLKAVKFIKKHFGMTVCIQEQKKPAKTKYNGVSSNLAQALFAAKQRLRRAQSKLEVEADICVALASQIPQKQISINVGNNNTNTNIEVKA